MTSTVVENDRSLNPKILLCVLVFCLGLFCFNGMISKVAMVLALSYSAIVYMSTVGKENLVADIRRSPDWWFLLVSFAWTLLGEAIRGTSVGVTAMLLSNILLMALWLMLIRGVAMSRLGPTLLKSIILFGAAEALISIVVQVFQSGALTDRLLSIGRAENEIPAAGGYAMGLIAMVALVRSSRGRATWPVAVGAAVCLASGLLWTGSRGPITALIVSLVLMLILGRHARGWTLMSLCVLSWVLLSSSILFEGEIRTVLCTSDAGRLCAQSHRLEVWGWVFEGIRDHPILGLSPSFRFSDYRPHPHNGIAALAFENGIPFLVAFILLVGSACRRLTIDGDPAMFSYVVAALIFAFGYMGTDLPNPIGFINTHYLFLWAPVFWAFSPQPRTAALPRTTSVGIAAAG